MDQRQGGGHPNRSLQSKQGAWKKSALLVPDEENSSLSTRGIPAELNHLCAWRGGGWGQLW